MASAAAIQAGEAFVRFFVNDTEAVSAMKALKAKVTSFASEVSAIGKGVLLTSGLVSIPFMKAMRTFAGYEDRMSAVAAIVRATDKEFETLNRTAQTMASSFRPTQIAEGMLELGRAGFQAEEIIASIPGTLNLARAGAIDLGEATSILANTIRSFGMEARDADRVGDVLSMTANISTTDIKGIGDAMKHVASSAFLSGQSLERVSGALAIMANRGLEGELAGTALARTLVKLADVKTIAFLKNEYNIDTVDAQGNMRDMLDIIRDLNRATKHLGNAQSLALFKDLFDMRGMKGAINLAENVDEWDRITIALKEADGTAAEVAARMDQNVGGAFRHMHAAVETLYIALGEALDETLRSWGLTLAECAKSASEFIRAHEKLAIGLFRFGVVATAVGATLYGLGKGIAMIASVAGFIGRLHQGFSDLHNRLTGVTAAQEAHAQAVAGMKQTSDAYLALLDKEEKAQARVAAASEQVMQAKNRLQTAKIMLMAAEQRHTEAVAQQSQQRVALAEAEAKAVAATKHSYKHREILTDMQEKDGHRPFMRGAIEQQAAYSGKADEAAKTARAEYVAACRNMNVANREVDDSMKKVAQAHRVETRAMEGSEKAGQRLAKQTAVLARAKEQSASASHLVTKSSEEMAKAMAGAEQSAKRTASFLGQFGSTGVISAAGALAMLSGSIAMVAGDTVIGKIAGTVSAMSSMVFAASSLALALNTLIAQYGSLTAALWGLTTAIAAATKAMIVFLLTNPVGWAILAAAALGGLVYWFTRADDSAQRLGETMKKTRQEAEGMASAFAQAMENNINRWLTPTDDEHRGQKGEGLSTDDAIQRLEDFRTASRGLAKDMQEVRQQMFALWDEPNRGSTLLWTVEAQEEFTEKSIQDSRLGEQNKWTGVNWTATGYQVGKFTESLHNVLGEGTSGSIWTALLQKYQITPEMAEQIGLDESKTWAANEEALKRYAEEYDKLIARLQGVGYETPIDRASRHLTRNKDIVEDLEKAWKSLNKRREEYAKRREERTLADSVDDALKDDPYKATVDFKLKWETAENEEKRIADAIKALEEKKAGLLKNNASPLELDQIDTELIGLLRDFEKAMENTEAWESFYRKATKAVAKTREELQQLQKDAAAIDQRHKDEQDDKRFKALLENNWTDAAKEVAGQLARVNREWLENGREVATLMAQAENGDMAAQLKLQDAIEQREKIAERRKLMESRDKEVKSDEAQGKKDFLTARDYVLSDAKYYAKKYWNEDAEKNPALAGKVLSDFITDLEYQLSYLGILAEMSEQEQDYETAASYAEQAKEVSDDLRELRSLESQSKEKDQVTGEFNAKAMEAMMRGGSGGDTIPEEQLNVQREMKKNLERIVEKIQPASVVATE